MRLNRLIALAGLLLASCASPLASPHATLERGEIAGELAYVGAVDGLEVALASRTISQTDRDAAWRKAWADLQAFRRLYNAGQSTAAALATLRADNPGAR